MSPVDCSLNEFELTSHRAAILDTADRFARIELAPLFARMDTEEWWPEDVMRKIGSAGLIGVSVDDSLGGAGMDFFCQGLVIQAIASLTVSQASPCVLSPATRTLSEAFDQLKAELVTDCAD